MEVDEPCLLQGGDEGEMGCLAGQPGVSGAATCLVVCMRSCPFVDLAFPPRVPALPTAMERGALQAHDVLWLKRGPDSSTLLFGVWRWGSQVSR